MEPAQAEADLLALIAGKAPRRVSRRTRPDSKALVEHLLKSWQILPSISDKVLDGALRKILWPDDHRRLRNCRVAITAFAKAQIAASRLFLRALDDNKLSYSLLKGAATAHLFYDERFERGAWDFDVGVAKRDLEAAERLALDSGYHFAQQDPKTKRFHFADYDLRKSVEANHYELGFLMRRLRVTNLTDDVIDAIREEEWTHLHWPDGDKGTPWCYAALDIHHSLSLDIGLDDLLSSASHVDRHGERLRVPDNAWIGVHLVFKLYWEGVHGYGKGLYQYADLIRLLPHLDVPTFSRFADILEKVNMTVAGHYVLRRLPLFGVAVSDHIREFTEKSSIPPSGVEPMQLNDLGDMWPKLWGHR